MTVSAAAITAVIVLYERAPEDSEAFLSMQRILSESPEAVARLSLILYDNSPAKQSAPAGDSSRMHYVHDAANGGLVAAYSYALGRARETNSEWLLLLDQDTTLTPEYVQQMLAAIEQWTATKNVAAIVPILEMDGRVYSPELDFFYHLRHQFPWMRNYPLARNSHGIRPNSINAYNSGAALRVSALEAVGGFPQHFRVDYLDHAVFRELQRQGFSIFVVNSLLQQKLSHIDLNQVSLARHASVLQSQTLYVARYGTFLDRLLFRFWLLRKARHYRVLCEDERVWKAMVRQAFAWWRVPRLERAS